MFLGSPSQDELSEVRKSYEEFLHSLRSDSKSPDEKEQKPLFQKVSCKKEVEKKDDMKIQDISSEDEQ